MTILLKPLAVGLGVFTVCVILSVAGLTAEPISQGTLGTAPGAQEQIQEVEDAKKRFVRGDFDGAFELLKEAAKKHAELPPPEIMMAQLFGQVNQGGGVRLWLEKAVLAAPKDPEACVLLGDFALRQRQVTEADLLYNKAASLIPNVTNAQRKKLLEPRVYAGQAAVAENRAGITDDKKQAEQEWITAQKHLEAWLTLELKPEDKARALQRLGRALFMQLKAQEAKETLEKAAEANPKILNWAAQLALLYQRKEDSVKAKQWMTYARQLKPNDLPTWLRSAQWSLGTRQLSQAQEEAAKAMQIDPRSLEAKILRGVIAMFQKDYKAAELYFEDAHLQSPGNFQASNNLAKALCEQDETKKRRALEYARANAERYPKQVEAASTYGWVLYKMGNQLDAADRVLNAVLRTGNFGADTAYYIARVATKKQRPEEAKRLLNAAFKRDRPFAKEQEAKALLEELNR